MISIKNEVVLKETQPIVDGNLIAFVGNFGSGKTEVAVNFAKYLAKTQDQRVKLIDLDIVNPYFRSREARKNLESFNVEVIAPVDDEFYADTPIISPKIKSEIQSGSSRVILDVGGDDLGARILSSLFDAFQDKKYELLLVLNISRPFTEDVEGCLKIMREIETASRLKVTGLVSNSHLIEETTSEIIKKGYILVLEVSEMTKVPVKFITVDRSIESKIGKSDFSCPILPIERLMLKPWERGETFKGRLRGI